MSYRVLSASPFNDLIHNQSPVVIDRGSYEKSGIILMTPQSDILEAGATAILNVSQAIKDNSYKLQEERKPRIGIRKLPVTVDHSIRRLGNWILSPGKELTFSNNDLEDGLPCDIANDPLIDAYKLVLEPEEADSLRRIAQFMAQVMDEEPSSYNQIATSLLSSGRMCQLEYFNGVVQKIIQIPLSDPQWPSLVQWLKKILHRLNKSDLFSIGLHGLEMLVDSLQELQGRSKSKNLSLRIENSSQTNKRTSLPLQDVNLSLLDESGAPLSYIHSVFINGRQNQKSEQGLGSYTYCFVRVLLNHGQAVWALQELENFLSAHGHVYRPIALMHIRLLVMLGRLELARQNILNCFKGNIVQGDLKLETGSNDDYWFLSLSLMDIWVEGRRQDGRGQTCNIDQYLAFYLHSIPDSNLRKWQLYCAAAETYRSTGQLHKTIEILDHWVNHIRTFRNQIRDCKEASLQYSRSQFLLAILYALSGEYDKALNLITLLNAKKFEKRHSHLASVAKSYLLAILDRPEEALNQLISEIEKSSGSTWQLWCALIQITKDFSGLEAARTLARFACEQVPNVGHLHYSRLMLEASAENDLQIMNMAKDALLKCPRSGFLHLFVARLHMNPISSHFNLPLARKYIQLAYEYTKQLGDILIEAIRLATIETGRQDVSYILPQIDYIMPDYKYGTLWSVRPLEIVGCSKSAMEFFFPYVKENVEKYRYYYQSPPLMNVYADQTYNDLMTAFDAEQVPGYFEGKNGTYFTLLRDLYNLPRMEWMI